MLFNLILLLILVYITCFAGIVFGCNLALRTKRAWIGSLSITLIIVCVISLYAASLAFAEEVQLITVDFPHFKLSVGGEGFRDKIEIKRY